MRRPVFALCTCALPFGIPDLLTLASAADTQPGPPLLRQVSDVGIPVDAETLERQYVALSSMPAVKVAYSALGPVRSIQGATGIVLSNEVRNYKPGDDAFEVLRKCKDVLLAAGSERLEVRLNRLSAIGRTIRLDQSINGIPVLYGSVSVGIDDATGLVTALGATFLPDRGLPREPKISAAAAAKRVEKLLVESGEAKPGSVETSTPSLAYTGTHPNSTRGHLIWAVPARFTSASAKIGARDGIFWIDAVDGEQVGRDALSRD